MFVHVDATLFGSSKGKELQRFWQAPFTQASCEHVERHLPIASPAYRALAPLMISPAALPIPSMANRPEQAFQPLDLLGMQRVPAAEAFLLKTNVLLLEEEIRDRMEILRRKSDPSQIFAPWSESDMALALRAMSLHEAICMTFAGLYEASQPDRCLEFSLTPRGQASLYSRLLSMAMQNEAETSLRVAFEAAVHRIKRQEQNSSESIADHLGRVLDETVPRLLDVFFSISQHMQRIPAVKTSIVDATKLCRWLAVLELIRLAGEQTFRPNNERIQRLGLDPEVIDRVLASRTSALSSDKGVYRTAMGELTLGGTHLAHAIQCCKAAVLPDVSALGKAFEQAAIARIQDATDVEDYQVFEGISMSGSDRGANYDCDMILFDKQRQKIFFLQAKWKRNNRIATIDDELTEWNARNSALTHAVDQLVGLRDRLGEKRILDQVRNRLHGLHLSEEHILRNAHFAVIHTLPSFNACLLRGVAMYEWNYFRNVLRRGEVMRTVKLNGNPAVLHALPSIVSDDVLPIEDPVTTLDHFLRSTELDPDEVRATV